MQPGLSALVMTIFKYLLINKNFIQENVLFQDINLAWCAKLNRYVPKADVIEKSKIYFQFSLNINPANVMLYVYVLNFYFLFLKTTIEVYHFTMSINVLFVE